MILAIVVVGGITRLTQSGLSMVKWEPIIGVFPPLSQEEWLKTFEMYKQSPEFNHYNSHFSLSDFKSIFFWEYTHRLIARIIGLVFIVPCIIFWVRGHFDKKLKRQMVVIFILGLLQGVLGWVMVKSGLVDNPHVSHYRLAAHLITALGLVSYIFWVALSVNSDQQVLGMSKFRSFVKWFIGVLVLQLIYGAFVAGLKAGFIYNTYPKMGENWLPLDANLAIEEMGVFGLMESGGLVQFIHRTLAVIVLVGAVLLWRRAVKEQVYRRAMIGVYSLVIAVGVQFALGVLVLLLGVPVYLGVLHQFVAAIVLMSAVYTLHAMRRIR